MGIWIILATLVAGTSFAATQSVTPNDLTMIEEKAPGAGQQGNTDSYYRHYYSYYSSYRPYYSYYSYYRPYYSYYRPHYRPYYSYYRWRADGETSRR
jgi:hypothetical protein